MAIAICTTTSTREEAGAIAKACVEAGLAACVHIDTIESCFIWDGALCEETEYRLMIKASDAAYTAVEAQIAALHSYDEPAVYVLPITAGSQSYLGWIESQSKGALES